MNKRRIRKNKRRNDFISNNPATAAFLATFLMTLAVGCIFLVIMVRGNREGDEIMGYVDEADVAVSSTRVPFAERILSGDPDGLSFGADEQILSEADAGDALEGTEVQNGSEAFEEAGNPEGESAEAAEVLGAADSYWERHITSSGENSVTLAFAGDILLDPGYAIMNRISQNGGAIDGVVGAGLLGYMRSADIMVINNEFPYSDRGTPTEGKSFTFHASPSSAAYLNMMGVDVATLANNHTYDYGETALLDTLSAIDSQGVARIGAGSNIDEASHPIYFTTQNGIRVAIIAATEIERLDNPDTKGATDTSPGVFRCLDITRLQNRIREAKETGAYVIVYIHWGTESQEEIDWWQQKQGPEIADAGADLIVGAHPHILQKIGYVNNVPVIYSLGNYLFSSKTMDTGLLRVTVNSDHTTQLQLIPALQSGCNVNEATGESGQAILDHLRAISPGVSIDAEGNITKN